MAYLDKQLYVLYSKNAMKCYLIFMLLTLTVQVVAQEPKTDNSLSSQNTESEQLRQVLSKMQASPDSVIPPVLASAQNLSFEEINNSNAPKASDPVDWQRCTVNKYTVEVCADGTQSIKLQFFGGTWKGYYHLMRIRIKEGADENRYGSFSRVDVLDKDTLEAIYKSPVDIDVSGKFLNLNIEIYFDSPNYYRVSDWPLHVYRVPVIMVHGLWSNNDAFSQMTTSLENSGFFDQRFLRAVNYQDSNSERFLVNRQKVTQEIGSFIRALTNPANSCIGVSKVDYIGHSMGGILGRLHLQSNDYPDNLHRLITINTPHSGSQLANILMSNYLGDLKEIICDYMPNASQPACDGGAIDDLRVDSDIIRNVLNGPMRTVRNVPSHVITTVRDPIRNTDFSPEKHNTSDSYELLMNFIFYDIFDGDYHDGVVALASQQGGMSCVSAVPNQAHVGSPANPAIISRVTRLLLEKNNSPLFCNTPFNPPVLPPPSVLNSSPQPLAAQSHSPGNIRIVNPSKGELVYGGDTYSISISGTNLTRFKTIIDHSADTTYLAQKSGNSANYQMKADPHYPGRKRIIVVGQTESGSFVVDSTYFYVTNICSTVREGNWNDESIWSCGHQPTVNDLAILNHNVSLTNKTIYIRKIEYNGGGLSYLYNGIKIAIGANSGTIYPANIISISNFSNPDYLLTLGKNSTVSGASIEFKYDASNQNVAEFFATAPLTLKNGFETNFTFSSQSGKNIFLKITNPMTGRYDSTGLALNNSSTNGFSLFPPQGYGMATANQIFDGKKHTVYIKVTPKSNGNGTQLAIYLDNPLFVGFPLYSSDSNLKLNEVYTDKRLIGIGSSGSLSGPVDFKIFDWYFKAY